jgi:hypothetical protein
VNVNAQAGKAIAALGVVFAFLGIWLAALASGGFSQSYWQIDGTLGAYLLVLAILGAFLLLGAVAMGRGTGSLALGAVGATLFGSYLFFPATLAFDQLGTLGAGAWLGLCTVLIVAGVAIMHPPGDRRIVGREAPVADRALQALGLVLLLVALWLKVDKKGGSYWSVPNGGHSLGAVFLVLIAVCAACVAAAYTTRRRVADLLGAAAAFVLLGLVLFIPVGEAFKSLGDLRLGAWLGLVGGILLAVGSAQALKATRSEAPPLR